MKCPVFFKGEWTMVLSVDLRILWKNLLENLDCIGFEQFKLTSESLDHIILSNDMIIAGFILTEYCPVFFVDQCA